MKSLKFLSTLAVAATLFTQSLFANTSENTYDLGGTTVTIAATAENVIVNLGTVEKETVIIRIEDKDQNTLLTETVKNSKDFAKKYKVNRLEDGNYRLIVTKKTIRTVQPFSIKDGVVSMSPADQKEKFLPTVNFHNNKLDVNVLLGNYSNIYVKLYDQDGKTILHEKHYVALQLNQRYNLEQLPAGSYTAEVKAGDETFTYELKK
jgi:hypothetical protein